MAGKVGFIGLGNMGGPMALNLVKAGFELLVHDINPARLAPLVAAGATVVASPEAAAAECRRTICMVETTAQAEAVILGDNGFIKSAKQGDIVLCMSTIDPLAARRIAERLAETGVAMVDAPVSGGTHGAAAATLSVIVGGPDATFAACEDLFRAMGKNVFHVGGHGLGLAMKLINNMLGQIQTIAIAGQQQAADGRIHVSIIHRIRPWFLSPVRPEKLAGIAGRFATVRSAGKEFVCGAL